MISGALLCTLIHNNYIVCAASESEVCVCVCGLIFQEPGDLLCEDLEDLDLSVGGPADTGIITIIIHCISSFHLLYTLKKRSA